MEGAGYAPKIIISLKAGKVKKYLEIGRAQVYNNKKRRL